jgi:hypothetical protein
MAKAKLPVSDPVYREGVTGLRPVVHYFIKETGEQIRGSERLSDENKEKEIETKIIHEDLRGKKKENKEGDPF